MTPKRIAILDLGTNTFHILIALIKKDSYEIVRKERVSVKIGQGGINDNLITPEAQQRALNALTYFKTVIDSSGVDKVFAMATSAIRNAKNGKEFVDLIKTQTQIDVHIITGDEEAEFIYHGVKEALEIGEKPVLIMDIGGGSVEFILCNNSEIYWKQSFEIGAQRLLDIFHYHDPIIEDEIINLDTFLTEQLAPMINECQKIKPVELIGSSGAFDTLSDIYQLKRKVSKMRQGTELPLPVDDFFSIFDEIITKTRAERMLMPGMIEMRVDMIIVACCLIRFVLQKSKVENMRVSSYSLKEGVLNDIIESYRSQLRE